MAAIKNKTLLLCLLALAACQPHPKSKNEISDSDLRAGHVQRMILGVPEVLIDQSTRAKNPLNLNDPEQVAHALGVRLTGDNSQVIYVMQMTAPSSDDGVVRREIPIRVDNIHHGAQMIREWQSPSL